MSKGMKTRKGKDGIYYPYTSPDIVVDSAGESQTTKNNNMKTDIDSIKTDLGTEELTTTAKDVKGAVNEVAAQYKEIANGIDYLKGKNVVMFGDSIMDVCGIPENIATLTQANIYNVGFQGCSMAYVDTVDGYEGNKEFSGYSIIKSVKDNDFSAQDNAITNNSKLSVFSKRLATLKSIDFSTIDIITIAYGTNDFGFNKMIGCKDDDNINTVVGAMRSIVNNIQSINSNAEVIFMTPIYRADRQYNNTNTLEDYVDVIKNTASSFGIRVIDLHSCSGINEFNFSTTLRTDKLHPNEVGSLVESKAIIKYIKTGYVGKTMEEFQKPNSLVLDSENFNIHDINNRACVINGKKYLTHAKTDYLRYKDIKLVEKNLYIRNLDTLILDFRYIDNSAKNARVDVIIYDDSNTVKFQKFTGLAKATNEVKQHLEISINNITAGYYKLCVVVKAMDVDDYVYVRDFAIEKKEFSKIMYGTLDIPLTVDDSAYTDVAKIYTGYDVWGEKIIPIIVATPQDDDIICNVCEMQYQHFRVRIRKKDGSNLENGKTYKINYIGIIPI